MRRSGTSSETRDTLFQARSAAWLESLPDGNDPDATLRPAGEGSAGASGQSGYAIAHELGRGGMGTVHAAEQRAFGRLIALKSLLVDTPAARQAFWAEAVATASLEHPNIVPVHDLVISHGGVPQLAMKLVEGSTWKSLLHPRSEAEKAKVADWEIDNHLEILLKVCDGVAFAHTRGILHRDLKPENVMVGGFGEVLVMDWGCAVAMGPERPHPLMPLAAESRVITGTPAYMPVELAMGDGKALGPWSDVYLLGGILYEILCGSPPHRGKGVKAVLELARIGAIEPPEQRAPEKAMPDELVALANEALARDPAKRIRDVATFAGRLRDYLRHSQAATLLDRAREHLKAAEDPRSSSADEALRRAIGCCEQAQDLWPGFRAARRLHVRAALAAARNGLATGSFHLAHAQADHARRLAKELGQLRDVTECDLVLRETAAAEAERASRARQVRLLRRGLAGAGAAVALGLVIGIALISLQQRATRHALEQAQAAKASAQQALASLEQEQAERQRQAREAAPRFIAEAEGHMRNLRWEDAARTAEMATALDPASAPAWRQLAEIRCGDGDLPAARAALAHTGSAGDALLAVINRAEPRLRQAEAKDRQQALFALADDLRGAGAALAAGYLRRGTKDGLRTVLEDARIRLAAANPKVANLAWKAEVADDRVMVDCSSNAALTDLSPLAGLGITELNCADTGITQVGVATSLPLTDLNCSRTKVDDIAPLAGLALTRLTLRDLPLTSLEAVKGMPLRFLDCTGLKVKDWTPLRGLPLQSLLLSGTSFTDFGLLTGMPLRTLGLDYLRIQDLNGVRGLALRSISINGTKVSDLTPLAGMSIEAITIGNAPVTDLTPVSGPNLQRLGLMGNRTIKDLNAVRASPIVWMDLRECALTDVEQLAGFSSLKTLSSGMMPPLRLLPGSSATAAGIELRATLLIDRLAKVPALADTLAGLRTLVDVAVWKQRPDNGRAPNAKLLGARAFVLMEVPVTWDEAKRIAVALGGRLACLEDDAAMDFVKKTWPDKTYFLGASRSGDTWKWLSGATMKTGRWEVGHPPAGSDPRMLRAGDKGWSDATADNQASFLVEWVK